MAHCDNTSEGNDKLTLVFAFPVEPEIAGLSGFKKKAEEIKKEGKKSNNNV